MEIDAESLQTIRDILLEEDKESPIYAAYFILEKFSKKKIEKIELSVTASTGIIHDFLCHLMNKGLYREAAMILWSEDVFTVKPKSVKMVWEAAQNYSELLIIGAGSLGKTYSLAVYLTLDWLHDPEYTCLKVISSTQEHAKRNIFAQIKNLLEMSAFKLPLIVKEKSIQFTKDDKQGIQLVSIPQGDEGKGRLRGFHPVPRRSEHPFFGKLSRIRVMLDEGEEVPGGVWEDVDNILGNKDEERGNVKIFGATNPKDKSSRYALRVEPKDGWGIINGLEGPDEWDTKLGWHALRLDGSKCENVVERKIIYPGLLTWEGFQRYLSLGDNSPTYCTMARGIYPIGGLYNNVIPGDFIDRGIGTFIFEGRTTYCSSTDLAFEGGDKVVTTIGRWGNVVGWIPLNKAPILFDKPRHGLQIEQQFELKKSDTDVMSDEIVKLNNNLKIPAEMVAMDRTGNGTGCFHMVRIKMKGDVLGIHYAEKATDYLILEDQPEKASDLYDGVRTEMIFSMRSFLEYDCLKFHPSLNLEKIRKQATSIKYRQSRGELLICESKKEYKTRNGESPDEMDSCIQLIQLVRVRSNFTAEMIPKKDVMADREPDHKMGIVEKLEFIDFNKE